ncbi:MAG: polyhydroxyalkanoic acid synthase [Rhodobacteraceae bacterium]|nr:polyhydroxyalkanoic acid synthase [Paracoccaceae bacterium]
MSSQDGHGTSPDKAVSQASHAALDRMARAGLASATLGLAPSAMLTAWTDWAANLATAPGKQAALAAKAWMSASVLANHAASLALPVPRPDPFALARPGDRRFAAEQWQDTPFNLMAQAFLATEAWWEEAATGVRGLDRRHEAAMAFAFRQVLDAFAPANFAATNPEVLSRIARTGGRSLVDGMANLVRDISGDPTGDVPVVGHDLAVTPGKVVARTHLAELIQYAPATGTVHPEPVLIVPAWIMKYYVLDLAPRNSLIRWLVDQGFTVFCLSWRNPDAEDAHLDLQDYLEQGPRAAIAAIAQITGASRIHAAGYCLGGTLMAMAAAAMARDGDARLASLTLLAAQTDFTEPGELALFLGEAQVALLEDLMSRRGYLESDRMAGAFTLLRSNDLIWSRLVREYMLGERSHGSDLMAWNADTTRMPARMHAQYLREIYLENALARGRFRVDGRPVALRDITAPIFALGTETDHVAPWKSVFKAGLLTEAEATFCLTSGGHNAGIVSEPGHPRRHYRLAPLAPDDAGRDPEAWVAGVAPAEGSWWPAWGAWLAARSGPQGPVPPMGKAGAGFAALDDAPGTYVFQR